MCTTEALGDAEGERGKEKSLCCQTQKLAPEEVQVAVLG